jgi:hypothetical protein
MINLAVRYEDVFGRRYESLFYGYFNANIPHVWRRL